MGKPELRECPFCGADAYFLDEEPGNFMVCCRDCSATSVVTASRAKAVNAWNRRTAPPVALPVVERVVRHPIVLEEGAAPLAVPGEPPPTKGHIK